MYMSTLQEINTIFFGGELENPCLNQLYKYLESQEQDFYKLNSL